MVQKAKQFLEEVKAETKKVTWPSKKDTTSGTIAVVIFVLLISFFLGMVDLGLARIMGYLIK